jgi:hypothetical protein
VQEKEMVYPPPPHPPTIDADRARERLEFEAAAEAIEKVIPSSVLSLAGMNERCFESATIRSFVLACMVTFPVQYIGGTILLKDKFVL